MHTKLAICVIARANFDPPPSAPTMYSIIVTSGPSLDESTHQCIHVNSESFVPISNEHFQGQITVRVKDFSGKAPEGKEPIPQSEYFNGEGKDNTFSIEATGEL